MVQIVGKGLLPDLALSSVLKIQPEKQTIMKIDFSSQKQTKIEIKERNTIQFVDVSKITHLKCEGYITTINILDSEPIIVSKLLKDFESELEGCGFIRTNRSTPC